MAAAFMTPSSGSFDSVALESSLQQVRCDHCCARSHSVMNAAATHHLYLDSKVL
ncbi:MAG: hypothetical protein M3Z24_13675 [Chloroflexota bacterium]|nr:hypothetical protein [Chloroflexota bacterium]